MKATTLKQIIASLLLSLCAAHFAGALEPARTTAPAGPYHAGRLNFTTPGGQAVNLSSSSATAGHWPVMCW